MKKVAIFSVITILFVNSGKLFGGPCRVGLSKCNKGNSGFSWDCNAVYAAPNATCCAIEDLNLNSIYSHHLSKEDLDSLCGVRGWAGWGYALGGYKLSPEGENMLLKRHFKQFPDALLLEKLSKSNDELRDAMTKLSIQLCKDLGIDQYDCRLNYLELLNKVNENKKTTKSSVISRMISDLADKINKYAGVLQEFGQLLYDNQLLKNKPNLVQTDKPLHYGQDSYYYMEVDNQDVNNAANYINLSIPLTAFFQVQELFKSEDQFNKFKQYFLPIVAKCYFANTKSVDAYSECVHEELQNAPQEYICNQQTDFNKCIVCDKSRGAAYQNCVYATQIAAPLYPPKM